MSIQARISEIDPRLYNVNRDVAHNFADVMREVADRMEKGRWEELTELLKKAGVTDEQLGRACEAACNFVRTATVDKKEDMRASLVRCGWFDVRPEAQMAVCSLIGTVAMGYFYHGVKEATMNGVGPTATCQDLREAGARAAAAMSTPRWRRRLVSLGLWASGVANAIRGRR